MHGSMNSTLLTKAKNDVLASIEKDREYMRANHPEVGEKFMNMMFDQKRKAIVDFYYVLMNRL